MFTVLLILGLLVALDILAIRFGHDSRDGFDAIDANGRQPWRGSSEATRNTR